jgi:hypothetical protein
VDAVNKVLLRLETHYLQQITFQNSRKNKDTSQKSTDTDWLAPLQII